MSPLQKMIVLTTTMSLFGIIQTLCVRWLYYRSKKFNHVFVQAQFLFFGNIILLIIYVSSYICCRPILEQEPSRDQKEERTRRTQRIHRLREQQKQRTDNGMQEDEAIAKEIRELETDPIPLKLNIFLFVPPAIFTVIATGCRFIGFVLTYQLSFQMLRGTAILFTGLLSVAFLGRSVKKHGWLAIIFIVCGLLSIGGGDMKAMSAAAAKTKQQNGVIAGSLMIVLSEIIYATRMTYEEKFVNKYNVHPLLANGLEGLFGCILLAVVIVPLNFIDVGSTFGITAGHMEYVPDAIESIDKNIDIRIALVGLMISVAFYNFAGLAITKVKSATTRMVFDAIQTLPVWIVSLSLEWRIFHGLHLLGFILIAMGYLIYAEILTCGVVGKICCFFCRIRPEDRVPERREPILSVHVDDNSIQAAEGDATDGEAGETAPLLGNK